jgi:hypothetical protein
MPSTTCDALAEQTSSGGPDDQHGDGDNEGQLATAKAHVSDNS